MCKTYEELCNTYGVTLDILYYNNIIHVIRTRYNVHDIRLNKYQQEWQNIATNILGKPNDKTLNKKLYNVIIQKKAHYDAVNTKWMNVLDIQEDNKTLFTQIERMTIVNKLRSFQFKFLHRILFFNDKLYKWKLSTSTLCDFCCEALDSIEHRYLYCRVTQEFWRSLTEWAARKYLVARNSLLQKYFEKCR